MSEPWRHELAIPVVLMIVALLMRLVVALYYSDSDRMLRRLKLLPPLRGEKPRMYKRWDAWFAPFPFVWTWLDIFIGVQVARYLSHPIGYLLLTVWAGGRFRALQEFGHNAVHRALCPSRRWQWMLSDVFYQYPSFKREMSDRKRVHVDLHHRHPNHASIDPNRARVRDGGMIIGISPARFVAALFFPLTPRGVGANLKMMARNSMINSGATAVCLRLCSVGGMGAALFASGGLPGILFGWVIPLITTYQLFAWWALLAKHRWFVPGSAPTARAQEFIAGRPTDYPGFAGLMVRLFISPTSDAYHLSHSLYETVRWNYLPAIDRLLKIEDPNYTRFAGVGFFQSRDGIPSALSELFERLTAAPSSSHALTPAPSVTPSLITGTHEHESSI